MFEKENLENLSEILHEAASCAILLNFFLVAYVLLSLQCFANLLKI